MKHIVVGVVAVAAALGAVAFFGFSPFMKTVVQQFGTVTAGTTFNTAKVASVDMIPISSSATSSSVYNGDANDRVVTDAFVSCYATTSTAFAQNGAGLANWTWLAATTSGSAPATLTNTNYVMNLNVATSSTDDSYAATSTYTPHIWQRWKAGSYITFQPNGTTTNTVSCNVGVHYLAF
jgi:hypothetical protein